MGPDTFAPDSVTGDQGARRWMAKAGDPWRETPGCHVEAWGSRSAESVAVREVDDSESWSGTLWRPLDRRRGCG